MPVKKKLTTKKVNKQLKKKSTKKKIPKTKKVIKNKEGKTNAQLMRAGRRPRFSIIEEFINKKVGCNGEPLVSGNLNE